MNNFEITSASDENVPFEKLADRSIFDLLNSKIVLSQYTNFSTLFFIYQAFSPDSKSITYNDVVKLRRKSNVLELYVNVNYYDLISTNENDATSILAETYLRGIEKFLIGRKDFDGIHFYEDVKKLFIENNLLRI